MSAASTTAPAATSERDLSEAPDRGGRYTIAVLAKALDLIDLLDAHEALTLSELGARAGINKTTALRVLANLEERDYVERDRATSQYRLGLRLLQLGMRKSEELDLRTVARPSLKHLHAEFDETVNLAVPGEDGIVYIDILESPRSLRTAAAVGHRDDYHSTALGKAILAHYSPATCEELCRRHPLAGKTPSTIVHPEMLARELARVREQGYAVDDEENEAGARCLGAPIFNHDRLVIGAISISGPASRLPPDRFAGIAAQLVAASRDISTRMGCAAAKVDGNR